MDYFSYGFLIQIISIAFIFIRNKNTSLLCGHISLTIGLFVSLFSTTLALFSVKLSFPANSFLTIPPDYFRFDYLGLYFLFIIQLVALVTTIYSYAYLRHYMKEGKSIRNVFIYYAILLLSTQLIVVVNHTILFLIFWEMMCTSAYLGMIFEKEKTEVQTGSFYYLIASHVAIFLFYIFFVTTQPKYGRSFYFSGKSIEFVQKCS